MRHAKSILLISFSVFVGCQVAKPIFNQDRDIPENPYFTVIPVSEVKSERDFASEVEEYVIKLGYRLMRRPGFKAVETNTQAAQKKQDETNSAGVSASKTELYYSYQETHADYVLETTAENRRIKIIRTSTTEVLGLLELNRNNNYDTPGEQISEILGGIGISPKSAQKGKEILEIKTDVPVAPSKSLSSSLPQSTSRPMSEAERHTTFNNLLERGYKEYQVPVKASITFVSGLRQELYIFAEDTSSYMLGSSPTPDDMMKAKKEHIKEVVKQ